VTTAAYDVATIHVLWRRDLLRFFRQPSRLVGALGQPIIFWLVIGSGLAATFKVPGLDVGYMEYFFPGVVAMVVLFASIFAAVSIIEDRHQGFLKTVIAGPGSRAALVLGKCAGSATVALAQAAVFLLLAPLAGFAIDRIDWPLLLLSMVSMSFGLTAIGFAVAWLVDNVQGYHAIQMTLLVPLWVVSGAMFPPSEEHPIFWWLMRANPIAYAVSTLRHALYNGAAPLELVLTSNAWLELGVVAGFAGVALAAAIAVCGRRA
jgi:ABC-2 type transport system permease protein